MKKKLLYGTLACAMVLSLASCGGGGSGGNGGDGSVVLKFSDQNADGTMCNQWIDKFAELVSEKTNGTVTIEVYPNASLAAYDIEPCQSGIADLVQYVPCSAANLDSRLGAFDAPYIYESTEHHEAVFKWDSEPMVEINKSLEASNVQLLTAFNSGEREITCNFPIYSPSDMNGAKIRVVPGELYQTLFTAFGAAATPMNFSEVSTALITNVIDGQENPLNTIVDNSLYEIQDYLIMTNHMPTNLGMWINLNSFNSLSESQQQALQEAAYEATCWAHDEVAVRNEQDLQTCIDNGMTVIDEENGLDYEAFQKIAMSMYDTFADDWGEMPDMIRNVKY